MTEPCASTSVVVHVVIVIGSVVTTCFSAWLAHRSKVAERERHQFYDVMADSVGAERWKPLVKGGPARRGNGA